MFRGSDWDNQYETGMYKYADPYRLDKRYYDDHHHHHHHKDKHKMEKYHKWDHGMDEHKDRFRRDFDDNEWKHKKDEYHRKWKIVCDIGETDEYWLVRAELPGVRKDKLCVEMEGKDLIICGKKKKEFWHDKLLKKQHAPKHNQNCTCGSNCTCYPTCKCGASTMSKDEKGKAIEASLKGELKDTERKGDLGMSEGSKDMMHISWWKKERGGKGKFKRRIHLPKRVDPTAIEALYKDGVLEVLIKKPIGEKKLTDGHTIPVH